jgi:syntaxin 18
MTDKQRDEIDYEARMILQQQKSRLRALEDLEKQRIEKYSARSAMSKFMEDLRTEGTNKTVQLHRAGIFWYLNDLLKEVSDFHAAQQQIRLSRQLEKAKSTFHHVPESHSTKAAVVDEQNQAVKTTNTEQFSAELQMELENENNALLDELQVSLDKARSAEKSMYEISQLQTDLANHLTTQNEMIENLLENAFQTSEDVTAANQQLTSAGKRNRIASKIIIYASVIIGLLLLFYDTWL